MPLVTDPRLIINSPVADFFILVSFHVPNDVLLGVRIGSLGREHCINIFVTKGKLALQQ